MKKLTTFKDVLRESMQDEDFAKIYKELEVWAELSKRIMSYAHDNGLTYPALAKKAKVSKDTLMNLINMDTESVTVHDLICICKAAEINLTIKIS